MSCGSGNPASSAVRLARCSGLENTTSKCIFWSGTFNRAAFASP